MESENENVSLRDHDFLYISSDETGKQRFSGLVYADTTPFISIRGSQHMV